MMALPGYIFGGSTGETPASLRRKREIAQALLGSSQDTLPRNVPEGMVALARAISGRIGLNAVRKEEAEGRARGDAAWKPIADALTGASSAPYTTGAPGAGATTGGSAVSDLSGNAIRNGFMSEVGKAVTNPFALAAIESTGRHESGFSPGNVHRQWSDPSESGQAGNAGGIMSWRADRLSNMRRFAAANGGDPNRPSPELQGQFFVQEDPGLIAALQGAKSADEAQNAINSSWRFAGWNRPGGEAERRRATARALVGRFAGSEPGEQVGRRKVAEALMGPRPVQVASLDPTSGVAGALGANDPRSNVTIPPGGKIGVWMGEEAWTPTDAPSPMPRPEMASVQPAEVTSDAPKSDAWAGMREASPPPTQVAQGPSLDQLYTAFSSPWISEEQRSLIETLIRRRQSEEDDAAQRAREAADPATQLDLEYRRAQIDNLREKDGGDDETFFGNPIAIQTPNGIEYGQVGNKGSFRRIDIGQGNTFAPNTRTVDTGTELLTVGPGGEILERIPKQNRQEASEKEIGKAEGEAAGTAITGLPNALAQADQSIAMIDAMLEHPGRAAATGLSSWVDPRNYLAGTDATDFNVRRKQLEGRAFLQAFESLKGAGQITEIEGQKATEAIARLSTAQSDEAYTEALQELRGILEQGKARAVEKAGAAPGTAPAAAPVASTTPSNDGWIDKGNGVRIRRKQ